MISNDVLAEWDRGSPVSINDGDYTYKEIWGRSFHAGAGIQYIFTSGFAIECGFGGVFFERRTTKKLTGLPMPTLGAAWYFR